MRDTEQVMPHSQDAEASALGCMLFEPLGAIPLATTSLRLPESAFYVPAHRAVFAAIMRVAEQSLDRVDILTVTESLKSAGHLEMAGGQIGVAKLLDKTPVTGHAEYYLDIVRQKWLARRAIEIANGIASEGFTTEAGDKLIRDAPNRFHDATSDVVQSANNRELCDQAVVNWREAAKRHKAGDTKPMIACDTPWEAVTELMCGLEEGLTILAGRPSAGKTTMEDILSCHLAQQGKAVLRVTLDASARELNERALCRTGEVSLPHLKFGFGSEAKFRLMEEAAEKVGAWKSFIVDNIVDIRDIMTCARLHKARHDIALVTVDYIQQVQAFTDLGRDNRDTVARTTWISGRLKRLSHELKIPVLCLSQLSRDVEKENREPKLSDLRDSGSLEQDAHKVIFLYRNVKKCADMDKASPGATKHKRAVWFDVMKQKDGEIGRIPMWLYPPYFKFQPAADDEFSDDDLPQTRHQVDKEFAQHQEYFPRPEGQRFRSETQRHDDVPPAPEDD